MVHRSVRRGATSAQAAAAPVRRTLTTRSGALRLVVVADTHGRPHPRSREHIAALRPDYILHAGDIGDLQVLDELAELAPVLAIRGNIDVAAATIPETMTVSIASDERTLLTLLLLHIAVYGPKLRADAARLARSEQAQLVVCGHSHVPFIGRDAGLAIFNPGSIGPRRFQLPIVFGVMELEGARLGMYHVDCESGRVWQPPSS
jgi:putative phosphoesterase